MKKTLLLCFIHGFKGGDDTFGMFPSHLKAILSHALPKVNVEAITYPKYETRGDLTDCVGRFKEWLQNKVIDLEVANGTPSPTIDPSVRVVLIGHSMGGIVAAETIISITSDQPVPPSPSLSGTSRPSTPPRSSFMFPTIHALIAFDTPYLGISPSVVAHGASEHWNTATAAYNAYTNLSSLWGAKSPAPSSPPVDASHMLPPAGNAPTSSTAAADAAAAPLWQRWGKYAMFAGAAGAVAAGGAAAYVKREAISEGWNWVGSHLEFVGCLARGAEMEKRVKTITALSKEYNFLFADMYTKLGLAAVKSQNVAQSSQQAAAARTFCTLPRDKENRERWIACVNDKATAETTAHMTMFEPKNNPGYYGMSEGTKELLVEWTIGAPWYQESEGKGEHVILGDDVEMVEGEDVSDEMGLGVEEGFQRV
ncbi:hypothetical protein M501DRAFT_1008617 [Patellaria atrata CBS 101060]|uniref:AB hydrolase-1 domain-containing protein n=1 Tax=Patellaria atrata CBS 101060 TaxID=1346257 RepID=A0A9P4S471_9PEZI|nr:hypothetical protein M501DRAFT_1008617 [Patellaria atrata CBS 101060]